MRKVTSAISSISPNAMHKYYMLENRNNKNTLIQIYANLFESLFLPNIVQAKYSTFTVSNTGIPFTLCF